ncbi:MAG: hypothetical protein R3249_10655 [Nitriliruptorales bacterium]|nr:hypothetical protein [Nitriliruptorales bacterium]
MRLITTAATASLGLLLIAAPASAVHEGSTYEANLSEVADNDPGSPSGSASVEVSQDGETMTVSINATGLGNVPHALHFHGIVDGDEVSASSCPTASRDVNDDGVVDVAEGAPDYGGVVVSLTTEGDTSADSALAVERFPAGTSVNYSRSGIPIPDELKPNLAKLHIVVHGVDEDGNGELTADQAERSSLTDDLPREGTLPALCGTLTATGGVVQTGDGSSATGNNAGLIAFGSALVGAGALVALRRRPSAVDATI